MSSTPIFDAVLADAPADIWQASHIFPLAQPKWIAGSPTIVDWVRENLNVEPTPWQERIMAQYATRFRSNVLGSWHDPANLGSVA